MKTTLNKAFIFDMDGVIVNSEPVWELYEEKFLSELIGKDKYLKIKDKILGNSVSGIYAEASLCGFKMAKNEFENIYDQYAKKVYEESKITDGIFELIDKLVSMNFKIGIVSSARQYWINLVLEKFDKNLFQFVLSVEGGSIRPKPYPDGCLEVIKKLGSIPEKTIILEDSQKGVDAAKASGALTICLKEHLPKNYLPTGADVYINSVKELIGQIDNIKINCS